MHLFYTFKKIFETTSDSQLNIVKENSFNTKNKSKVEKKISNPSNCYVMFAKDGDTFVGMHENIKKTFRLAGIDTPEKGTPYSEEAKNYLNDNIKKKIVYISILGKDKYERDIVEVFLDKEKTINLNKKMISLGLATSERYTDEQGNRTHNIIEYSENESLEKLAILKNQGIWNKKNSYKKN